MHDLLIYD